MAEDDTTQEEDGPAPRPKAAEKTKPPRTQSAFGWLRRSAKLWGFLGFCILVVILTRQVVIPFVFALLVAYILAPLVRKLSVKADGTPRMHKGIAIVLCYIVFLAGIGGFLAALLPRLSADLARIGNEAPELYAQLNEEWTPQVASWIEKRFPSQPENTAPEDTATVPDVPLPPGTGLVLTPLPDGRYAIQVESGGLEVTPQSNGGYRIEAEQNQEEAVGLEEELRVLARDGLLGLQSQLGGLLRFGQRIVRGFIQSVFSFFLVFMIAAFILLDLEKIHGFSRSLIPAAYHSDYESIVAGIDRGLNGVIRGQLIICLVNGVFTYIGLVIFSVKYSLILGVVAGVLSLIPIFGTILSTLPIVLVAVVSSDEGIDLARGVFILLWILGIHFIEGNILNPKIIGTSAKIHPVLVIFALIVGENTYGLTGALLAVPVASVVQVFFLYFRSKAWRSEAVASS